MKNNKMIPEYDGPGIYALINTYSLSVYVGSTRNIRKRALQHYNCIKQKNHKNKLINKLFCFGSYRFIILEKFDNNVDDYFMRIKERMYIYEFSKIRCYNLCNHENNDIKSLEKLIFFEIFDYYGIRKNIDKTFHEEYGTNMLSMSRRNIERRI